MSDLRTKAAINLHSVLRNIEDVCQMDDVAATLIKGKNIAVRFSVPGIEKMTLAFKDGQCRALTGEQPCDINLHFGTPNDLNQMVDGKKNPLPTKGFFKLNFLTKDFPKFAERLTAYLKPDAKTLENDKSFRDKSTILTAYTAFYAISQVGNYDPIGKLCAKRIEDGIINIGIKDSVGVHIQVKDGLMLTQKGLSASPKAVMTFDNIDIADGILRGTLDSYACIGDGKLAVKGRIPMVDDLNKLLGIVSAYLA